LSPAKAGTERKTRGREPGKKTTTKKKRKQGKLEKQGPLRTGLLKIMVFLVT